MTVYGYLESRFRELGVPGLSCCVSYRNKLSTFNFGSGSLQPGDLIDDRSVFNIASVGKLITSVCVLKLMEQRSLTLNTTLGELLSDIPAAWKPVKVSQLLTHSSGIRNYTDVPAYWEECQLDVPKKRILEYVADTELEFTPGTAWRYSNTGFYLLGLIVENVSGTGYFDFADQLIATYKPGLTITRTDDRSIIPGRVTGYRQQGGEPVSPPYYSNSGTFSAGGFSATLHDFMDFENGLFNGKILNEDSLNLLIEPFIKDDGSLLCGTDPAFDFAMTHGLFRFKKDSKAQLAHGGEIFGYKTGYMRLVEDNFSAIISTNLDREFDSLEMLNKVYDLTVTKG